MTGILGQVWYLIVSNPDLCTLIYVKHGCRLSHILCFKDHSFITFDYRFQVEIRLSNDSFELAKSQ